MKAITLTQPWATLVAAGQKTIETRSWGTRYRGPLAIHAGKGLGPVGGLEGLVAVCRAHPFGSCLLEAGIRSAAELPFGAVVAVVTLVDVMDSTDAGRALADAIEGKPERPILPPLQAYRERHFGNYAAGRYAWLLNDARRLEEPIPCRGALGLWDVPDDILALLPRAA